MKPKVPKYSSNAWTVYTMFKGSLMTYGATSKVMNTKAFTRHGGSAFGASVH
jgi:hypothetical protein